MIRKIIIGFLSIFIINFAIQIGEKPSNILNQILTSPAQAEEVLKIKSINFDNSDAMIFLGTVPCPNAENITITKGKLSNPERVYFDIQNSILARPNVTYELKNSVIKQIKVAQFSTNPNVVRIVIEGTSNITTDKVSINKAGTGLVIKYKNINTKQDYLTEIYSDNNSQNILYSKTTAQELTAAKKDSVSSDEVFNKIQKAFKETTEETSAIATNQTQPTVQNQIQEHRLKSRYYINRTTVKDKNILISGIGLLNTDPPMYLTNPSRVVFDFQNTIVSPDLKNKEIRISETETFKIGQFDTTTARIVITTPQPKLYIPIYSNDLQNLLIADRTKLSNIKLSNTNSSITAIIGKSVNPTTNNLIIDFSDPVVHSIEKTEDSFDIYLYNVGISPASFKEKIAQTPFSLSTITQIQNQGIKISIPINKATKIDCYESLNATEIKISFKNLAERVKMPTAPTPVQPQVTKKEPKKHNNQTCPIEQSLSGRIIYLDPGHGGGDTGALKSGIAEKDINLDIAKKTAAILTKKGLHVELTRWDDSTVSLQQRVEMANSKETDIFVSIHINSSVKPEVYGIETHYYTDNGYEVARIVHKNIMSKVTGKDRGLFKSKFYVINHTEAPSVLLELGFISNDNERNALLTEERKNKSAEAISDGIIEYLKTQQKRTRAQ